MRALAAALAAAVFAAACAGRVEAPPREFVAVQGTNLIRKGEPYSFVGANFWYGCNLAALAEGGDRDRLRRELDLLHSLGIDNLRVMGASEGVGQPNTVWPPIQPELGRCDERLLDGLDFLLAEMARRDMLAVVVLNNYWEWSGGMAQYLSWVEGVPVPNPFFAENSWDQFMNFSARFYSHAGANAAFRRYVETLVHRKNRYTGLRYRDDPTIMAWQLANEPRPGRGRPGWGNREVFVSWIGATADFIRSLDPNHLISVGSEGLRGSLGRPEIYLAIHRFPNVDYLTVHLWVLNWSWYDPLRHDATYPEAERLAIDYIDQHIVFAEQLSKPLVMDEFGIPRDLHSYSPAAPTTVRDHYYRTVLGHLAANAAAGGPVAGSNFWTWGGHGAAADTDQFVWRHGDSFTGDPPQEPQGRNSVFAADASTLAVLERKAARMRAVR
ncbi:MAG TPA: cellulase family glycosylhydrolase [Thermoanaerobaculales bacterium]|nr:cellulase family glycosylhydrolase [Thermoanaerobaculales bacterium]HQL30379.1 cellulase family glycosylhydrolase [Thermoanaerobaculales bacterium]HQN96023.1 cellulase family glycosylhydrolase [Thermoanaerobaculales bacterium]HQP42999.1 cellulase family glycosylhydrolase [Thermoanaerobaculales bacterium]